MKEQMNSRERVKACFAREDADRPAVISPTSVATFESMKQTGAFFPKAHLDAETMAALAAFSYDLLGFDTISPYFSVQQEAAALGCDIDWGTEDSMPVTRTHPVSAPEDISIPEDFLDRASIQTVLQAIRILKKRYGDRCMIIGKVMGPLTLSYNLHGVQETLIKTLLEPDTVHALLDRFKEISILFAEAQFDAGADMLTWADHATGDLISPEGYRDFIFPVHRDVNRRLRKAGPVILHICGRTMDRMPYIGETGFEAFHFDSKNDISGTMDLLGSVMHLVGCVNNPSVLLNGTPSDVKEDVYAALDGGITLVAPECAVSPLVPNRNLKAIAESVDEYMRREQ